MTSIGSSTTHGMKKKVSPVPSAMSSKNSSSNSLYSLGGSSKPAKRCSVATSSQDVRGAALRFRACSLADDATVAALSLSDIAAQATRLQTFYDDAIGQPKFNPQPHTASNNKNRGDAAADLATAIKTIGILSFKRLGFHKDITQLLEAASPPPAALEGALFILRAMAEIVGKKAEPFLLPLLPLVLNHLGHSAGNIRDAAEDTSRSFLNLCNTHAVAVVMAMLFKACKHTEWRVKWFGLECFSILSREHPLEVSVLLPKIIPLLSSMVWDTKTQVSKSAGKALMDCCNTNLNPDVKPAISAVVAAIIKPSLVVNAVEELMHTTFIASVDSSTLSILCPILSRALKEKLTNTKRMASIVIHNMSKLVDSPTAVAPFGPLLVPDLKTVVENVQFVEIRNYAMDALKALTKALGHSSVEETTAKYAQEMLDVSANLQAQQDAIEQAKMDEIAKQKKEKEIELAERKKFKEAMDAARRLEKLDEETEAARKKQEKEEKEMKKAETKGVEGKCKACGFKKCKKSCMFYDSKKK